MSMTTGGASRQCAANDSSSTIAPSHDCCPDQQVVAPATPDVVHEVPVAVSMVRIDLPWSSAAPSLVPRRFASTPSDVSFVRHPPLRI
jgi:hypothetical protein